MIETVLTFVRNFIKNMKIEILLQNLWEIIFKNNIF